ncbi:HAMP domain-containing protein [Parafrankia soli]|uniref:HAMP domain-containing protein n=1 Tax=Parafrankia soli TaxID=2599596 RepID=UPI003B845783
MRARLLLALVGLLALGLMLGAFGTQNAVESYLLGRLDRQVRDAHPVMEQTLLGGDTDHMPYHHHDADDRAPRFGTAFLVGTYGALYDSAGRRVAETSPGPNGPAAPTRRPAVTQSMLAAAPVRPDLATASLWTVPAEGGGDRFRLLAERFGNGDVLVVAVPFAEMETTLDNVTRIEIIVSAAMLVVLAALAYVIIRLGLRPLTRIEHTAGMIADGDLTQRVTDTDRGTEVGRLGLAFNTMLTEIEASFRAREASERRLRRFVRAVSPGRTVEAVAAAHGGRAEHRPTPGGGATFRLVLPRPDPSSS